jgi:hypothetical protein
VPIFVAFFGVIAASVPILLDTILNNFYKAPNVDIEIIPFSSNGSQNAKIIMANTGMDVANNVSVIIQAPKEIKAITSKSHAVKLILTELNKTLEFDKPIEIGESFIQLTIPKFIFGSGSNLEAEISINAPNLPIYYNYSAVAIYEEGSSTGKVVWSDNIFIQEFIRLWGTWSHPYLILLYYGVFLPIIVIYFYRRKKRGSNKNYLSNLLQEIINIRTKIIKNPLVEDIIDITWNSEKCSIPRIGSILRVNDYVKFHDLYLLLDKRNNYVRKTKDIDKWDLENYNKETLEQCKVILKEIDWKMYF